MTDRDGRILDHIGLYRLTLRAVLSRRFLDGSDPANVLQRLRDAGLIRERRQPLRPLSFYQLTDAAARVRGFSVKRARPLKFQSLSTHLAVLWFCCMVDEDRRRLERHHLERLFPGELAAGPLPPHCLEVKAGRRRLYRIFVPGARTDAANLVHRLTGYVAAIRTQPKMGSWLEAGQYRFAVLCDNEQKIRTVDESLKRNGLKPVVFVRYAPGHRTIASAIRR